MSSSAASPKAQDSNDHVKETTVAVLEVLVQRFDLWYKGRDTKSDILLACDPFSLKEREEQFYGINDLSLDVNRFLISLTFVRNTAVPTSDTGGTDC